MDRNNGAMSTGIELDDLEKNDTHSAYGTSKSEANDRSTEVEKGEVFGADAHRHTNNNLDLDPYDDQLPIDEHAPIETQQFTVRAVLVGCILGAVIAASNVYLGLKTGWAFGASLFGAIFGFAILKPLSKTLPTKLGGGYFGPKENVCVQTAASAASDLGLLFTSGFPAAYQLGLLGRTPKEDFARLITFTACCAYYGMFFAVPLRKFYILKQKLVFPTPTATAHTIQSLHVGAGAESEARRKTKALVVSFSLAIIWKTASLYAPGILWDWHWGWTLYRLGWTNMIYVENMKWVWEWTPAFIGAGMLTGINGSYSFFGGAILAWGIIAPALVTTGKAFGKAESTDYPGYVNYVSMALSDPVNQPSPRYWLMWPGVVMMLCGAFAEVGANYKIFLALANRAKSAVLRRHGHRDFEKDPVIPDPAPPHELVPWWMWTGGLLLSIIFTCVVLGFQYGVPFGISLLAILFAFILAIIGTEAGGRTDIIPVTSIGNTTQLIVGGATKGYKYSIPRQRLVNISGAMIAQAAAEQSVSMLSDLKTGHLLRASPRIQFYTQLIGSVVCIFMTASMYVLFSTAYPCINDSTADKCSFPAPDVGAYRAIATAVTSPTLPIPPSAGYAAIGLGLFAILITVVKHRFVPPSKHVYVPNPVGMGIALILNTTAQPMAMFFGATLAWWWQRRLGGSYAVYGYAIPAGMIAGEGLGGIVGALLEVAKVGGTTKGTKVGCPGGEYCG